MFESQEHNHKISRSIADNFFNAIFISAIEFFLHAEILAICHACSTFRVKEIYTVINFKYIGLYMRPPCIIFYHNVLEEESDSELGEADNVRSEVVKS